MRIAIVNDVPMIAEGLARLLRGSSQHDIAWIAYDGEQAVTKTVADVPDVILMDLFMPVMNGAEATKHIMARRPCPILIVTSSVSEHIAEVFRAMGFGALDAISTPVLGAQGSPRDTEILLRKIETTKQAATATLEQLAAKRAKMSHVICAGAQGLVALGASAGGPRAIVTFLQNFSRDLPIAVVIVQHVNKQFAPRLAEWLNTRVDWPVQIAHNGDTIEEGKVYLAVSRDHLALAETGHLVYHADPIDYPYRPSMNIFFESVAKYWNRPACGVLLSGMGVDGVNGLSALREAGHYTVAQDETSSSSYGLPKAAKDSNAAIDILDVEKMGVAIRQYFSKILGFAVR